jgi:hypothetical protein
MKMAQRKTAPLLQEGHGGFLKAVAGLDHSPTLPEASRDYPQRIAAIHAQHMGLEQEVATGLARIAQAKVAARGASSASGREYWTFVATDEANRLESLLRIRCLKPASFAVIDGRLVPPTKTRGKTCRLRCNCCYPWHTTQPSTGCSARRMG